MMGWIVTGAVFIFLLWTMRRAREKGAELVASGEARSPLYWTGIVLVMSLLVAALFMAQRPSEIPAILWLVVFALMVATLLVRRALKWRYPH